MNRLLRASIVGVVLSVAFAPAGCSKPPPVYKSNVAALKFEGQSVVTADGKPYTGRVIARDHEIEAVASGVLAPALVNRIAGTDTTGLVLVMPIADGKAAGKAQLLVDLHAPRLNAEVARRSDFELEVGRMATPTIKIAEATFVAGRLQGVVTAYAPTKTGSTTKTAEITFADDVPHGKAVEYHPGTTQVLREMQFDKGTQVGPFKQFHANGKLEREATYAAGDIDGDVKEFYANGNKRALGHYAKGEPVGIHERWFPNGQLQERRDFGASDASQQFFSNGRPATEPPTGVIEEFYPSGALRSRTTYANGVKQGPFEQLYSSGKKWKSGTYESDKLHGHYQEWWKNGKVALDATYEFGALTGDFKRSYANGKDWETARYIGGRLDGPYRKWWKNGKPAHVYAYANGKLDGDYRQFYDNGAKWAEATYKNGKAQGAVQKWFPDGKLGYVMNHENGRPHGAYKRWWADGKPRLEATYVNGVIDGEYKNWLEDGTPYEIAVYQRGMRVSATTQPESAANP